MDRHLVLVGMMGAGKSSVGRRLGVRLGRPFVDIDAAIESRAGRSVPDIFATDGEKVFREMERVAVRDALASSELSVVAFGGGAVLDPANRELARQRGLVVWLEAPPGVLAGRVASSDRRAGRATRPLAASRDALIALATEREAAYQEAAHVRVDTSGRSTGQVATAVLRATGWKEAG